MSTCLDYGIDYPHAPVHCPACWDMQINGLILHEMRRANDLREEELNRQEDAVWVEPRSQPQQRPRPTYVLPQTKKGGMNIDPR